MNLSAALHAWLTASPQVTSQLSTYNGAPAIFTTHPAPIDAERPYITTDGDAVNNPADTKNSRGRSVWRDVRIFDDATGSTARVNAIAEAVRARLHRQQIPVAGHLTVICEVAGPTSLDDGINTDHTVTGRLLTVRLRLEEVPTDDHGS